MKNNGKIFAIVGVSLQLGPLLGLIGTVIGMLSAFQTMDETGSNNAEALAGDISISLVTTSIGLIMALVGIVLILIALFVSKYRAPWFFWFLIVASILMLIGFPVGTLIGTGLLIYLITHKKDFYRQKELKKIEATCIQLFGERDRTDYLGHAAILKQEGKEAIKEKDYDRAWKIFHEQKQQYMKHASRSEFTPSQTLALDASVSEDLANILRLEGKHTDALVHILYWVMTSRDRTKSQDQKLVAYINRAKIPNLELDDVNRFIDETSSVDFRTIQTWVSEQIK